MSDVIVHVKNVQKTYKQGSIEVHALRGVSCHFPGQTQQPGLLLQASQRFFSDNTGIISIGDSLRDLQAADNFGVRHIHVLTGNGVKTKEMISHRNDVPVYDNLYSAVQELLNN